jgi:exodeoxyribonuclease VII small subunit
MAKQSSLPNIENMSFEAALDELKEIVERLESGEGKLDEAIETYQRGDALRRRCEAKLREAKEKIEKISLGAGGQAKTDAFDAD